MRWCKRAQEAINKHDTKTFIIDGTKFVTRRALSRFLIATLYEADKTSDKTLHFGSNNSVTIDGLEGELPDTYRKWIGEHRSKQSYLKVFENAKIVGSYALGLAKPRYVIKETAGGSMYRLWPTISGMIRQEGLLSTVRSVMTDQESNQEYEVAASLVSSAARNYYHWVIEHLTQLRAIEYYAETEGEFPLLILPPDPPSWMVDSLTACGYDKSDWTEWGGNVASVDRLVVPESLFRSVDVSFSPSPENRQWLRKRIASNIRRNTVDNLDISSYIYISREDANSRRVVNRDELLAKLRPLGFNSYNLSKLKFKQQAALFSQAKLIVAPHGAGATNMVFSTDATFIELCHSENVRGAHYFVLAQECEHNYISVLCEPDGEDMIANVQQVINHIEI